MIHLLNIEEWAERFLQNDLSETEKNMLETSLKEDTILKQSFEQSLHIQKLLVAQSRRDAIKATLSQVGQAHQAQFAHQSVDSKISTSNASLKPLWSTMKRYWKPMAAAASIAFCSSLLTYTFTKENNSKKEQYVLLKREMESIKKSQNKIINEMKATGNTADAAIAERQSSFSGSGFAISNDGYFSTNYHVVEKADSIYLQMNSGQYYKASIIKVNPEADLAILKIEDKNFSFKQAIPYTIERNVASLGQRIFSIGYPKDEVVYNEGYISSDKGYDGNVLSYQLEITANPGQSGAPILDHKGNIVGIITGKQNNTSGTTFAVHAEQLISLIQDVQKENKLQLSSKNKIAEFSRPEQVKLLKDYMVSVKAF